MALLLLRNTKGVVTSSKRIVTVSDTQSTKITKLD